MKNKVSFSIATLGLVLSGILTLIGMNHEQQAFTPERSGSLIATPSPAMTPVPTPTMSPTPKPGDEPLPTPTMKPE